MNRIGFHYFPDIQHYRQADLQIWLPRLEALRANWLVLNAPATHAIPEYFLRALIEADIQPLLHFKLQPAKMPPMADFKLLFKTYQRWGVRYLALFDRPNNHTNWPASAWAQADLVEQFLDLYLPLANASLNAGLAPIFPPLQPGGDYWDTAFLRAALQSIRRRGQRPLLEHLVIGAYAIPGNRPLNWGAGGPERWPNAHPYHTPPGVEDQRGLRIFDWYQAITQAAISRTRPLFLFGLGYRPNADDHINQNLMIARLLADEAIEGAEAIPPEVIGAAFDPLVDPNGSADSQIGWFRQTGEAQPQAEALRQWGEKSKTVENRRPSQSIRHYLLLPSYEWGISDYHIDLIRPLIKKYQPTVGFSLSEARNARRVTVVGGEQVFSEESLNQLRMAGILVERITEDGTNIASILASLTT